MKDQSMSSQTTVQPMVFKTLINDRSLALGMLAAHLKEGLVHPQWTPQHQEAWLVFNSVLDSIDSMVNAHVIGYLLSEGRTPGEALLTIKDTQGVALQPVFERRVHEQPTGAEVFMRRANFLEIQATYNASIDPEAARQKVDDYLAQWQLSEDGTTMPVAACLPSFVIRMYAEVLSYKLIALEAPAVTKEQPLPLTMTLCNGTKTVEFSYHHDVTTRGFVDMMRSIDTHLGW